MTRGSIFWLLMILWAIFGVWVNWGTSNYYMAGGTVLQFCLFFLLGWQAFGFIIQDSPPPK